MPISYKIDKSDMVVHITTKGITPAEKEINILDEIIADPDFQKGMNIFENRLNVIEPASNMLVNNFIHWVSSHEKQLSNCKYAIVVSGSAELLMGRMGEALTEYSPDKFFWINFRAFKSVEKACKWLGIRNPAKYK